MTPPPAPRPAGPAAPQEQRWRSRPVLAGVLRAVLLAVPLLASAGCALLVVRVLPPGAATRWWGLVLVLVTSVCVAVAAERAARRLLPLAVLLKLSLLFPDRAPSRLRISREAVRRRPPGDAVVVDGEDRPVSVSQLVLDLVADLGAHDRRTRGHSERVRVLTDMLADDLRLDEDARDRLRWSALLHDVGKMQVSPSILNKPSRLDVREFELVRLHPKAGAELTAPLMPFLGEWGEGIVDHHERYDGGGYPAGKVGEQISVAGRILAVVDAFETMTAARPYKKAMVTRAAREELARCAGTHFDPVYVRAFLAISLPRVLWAMGPLSFLLQLPFLPSIAQAGARTGALGNQAATAAAGAAGAAVLATGGLVAAGDAAELIDLGSLRPPSTTAQAASPDARRPLPVTAERPQPPAATAGSGAPEPATRPAPPPPPPAVDASAPPPTAAPGPAAGPVEPPTATSSPPEAREARREPLAADQEPAPAQPAPGGSGAEDEPPASPHTGVVILDGPPSPTSDTSATFTLVEDPGVQWECKVPRNATGQTSTWRACSGTFTLELIRTGTNVLRVRDAATGQELDSWTWTVTSR